MTKTLFTLLLSLFFLHIQAQPEIEWTRSFGSTGWDDAKSLLQTSDGGYIISAYAATNDADAADANPGGDLWIIKLDGNGEFEWQKMYGGSNNDSGVSIQQTSDGGFILAGGSDSVDGDVSNNYGNLDVWVIKINTAGELEWEKNFGGSQAEWANDIRQTTDGGYIISGHTKSNNGDVSNGGLGDTDLWIIKLNENGNLEWERLYGGSDRDNGRSIRQTADGGFIVAGFSQSMDGDVNGDDEYADFWVLKLDEQGNLEWQKSYGGSNADDAYSIQLTLDGGFILAGWATSFDGDINSNEGPDTGEYWILKLSEDGEIEWEKSFGGTIHDKAHSVQQTLDGGYITAGYTVLSNGDYDALIIKLNAEGDLEWEQTFGGTLEDYAWQIQQTLDEGFVFIGKSWSNNGDVGSNQGLSDVWIVKLKPQTISNKDISISNFVKIFPNPSDGSFSVLTKGSEHLIQIEVFDCLGRTVYLKRSNTQKTEIEELPKGVYWVKISADDYADLRKIIVH